MRVNKKIKMLLAAVLISTSAFAMVGCGDKTYNSKQTKQEQSKDDAESSATKDNEGDSSTHSSKKEEKTMVYYTYDINTEKVTSHEKKTKDLSVNSLIDELIKAKVLPKDTKVKSSKIEGKEGSKTLVVDVNEKFIDQNLGTSAEMLQLQCFANSLIKSFNVKNVKLTVNGSSYSSGHIQMQENETLEYK